MSNALNTHFTGIATTVLAETYPSKPPDESVDQLLDPAEDNDSSFHFRH